MGLPINLLPWREEQRIRKNIEFGILAAMAAAAALFVVSCGLFIVGDKVAYQSSRNEYLKSEIKVLESKLSTIDQLNTTREALLSRMEIIQQLQVSRPQIVHVFEEVVATIPDGIWLRELRQKDDNISIKGFSESNARVSAYMRNLNGSDWFKDPVLRNIETKEEYAEFTLELSQDSPRSPKLLSN